MSLIKVINASLSIHGKTFFSDLNLTINRGDQLGIVGDNGAGKSSLLRSIAKQQDEHDGDIIHARGLRCLYVEQGYPAQWGESTAVEILENCLSDATKDQWKVSYTLEMFNFPEGYRALPFNQLSGGWKKIVMIAEAAILQPHVLLLDEPTNHLDRSHIDNLIRLLRQKQIADTFAVVSHNRDFLDLATKSTLFLHDQRFSHFKTGFTHARKLLSEQEQALSEYRSVKFNEIQRLKKSAHFQRQLGVNNHSDNAAQKAKKIERRVKSLEANMPTAKILRKQDITLTTDELNVKKILHIENLKLHSTQGHFLFFIKTLVINRGDRIVISGKNGSGKSTLLKAIIDGTVAEIKRNPSIRIGILDQDFSALPKASSALEFFSSNFEIDQQQAINKLASAGFSYLTTQKKIGQLSYGERCRLALLALSLNNPNFLILDEPTNHLDIKSQEALESEIQRLNPAAIIVSHDARFIENIGNRHFEITNSVLKEYY
ncbi:ATPase components of ABC transporters with duplicated ATPase domains [Pseudomonas sp. NFACC23-1]|uniref:ATP-binding cassette domain-containing protein n=1 Tax=unclassified Pseudomonas TaxID=196821 RepID=UPI000890528C|nr:MULTISPECIES: ATP-binding cassette domain-containing protein [unclassified Pseudomonas]SDB37429.1 ATPase components of ABC transporters with duplicated ATPase domains [Pseudomonas sp. NFACC17-2]SEJ54533.1 ATPase components of ABC transporters with duplicated ATPase domains [Pseudomonas sp. NFACC23-1]SFW71913.1 ATPase components of ABC transporters with duplicated ATPase domains [Pseudomonas sp. NFACC16-2]